MWDAQQAIIEANLSFYEAFATGDATAMARVWARNEPVVCIHPGWQPLYGRDQVLASWRAIFREDSPAIRCEGARVTFLDTVAHVTCVERIRAGKLAATNIFIQEEGVWRMVHHQASPFMDQPLPPSVIPPPGSLN
ncbi:MAG: nuclear transport factor 2 family protein [Myxococcota bacterium]